VSTTFTATAVAAAAANLVVISGNNQSLTPGGASTRMRVRLTNALGAPIVGAVVQWNASNGTLASATSTTDAAGDATNTVTALSSGAVVVNALYNNPALGVAAGPVSFNHNAGLANLPGLNGPQTQVANAIDLFCPALAALTAPTPGQLALLNDCNNIINAVSINPGAAIEAISELLPDTALAQVNASLLATQSQFQNLKARIAALRSGTQGNGFEGLAFTNGTGSISLGALGNALTGNNAEETPEVGADFQRWGFYVSGTIGRGETEAGSINPAYDYDINGITAGLDYRYSDRFIFGGALGFTNQDTDLANAEGTLETRGWSASLYSTFYQNNSWYFDSVLTYGQNTFDLERRITYTLPLPGGGTTVINQNARSDANGDMLEAAVTFGHDFQKGPISIGPYGRLLYTKLGFDQATETLQTGSGSGLGLVIETRDVSSIASQVGAKFAYNYSTDWGVLVPHLQLEWEHEFKDDPSQLTARFLNDPLATPIVINGDPEDTDYYRIGIGLSGILSKGRSGFFFYERVFGRERNSQYNIGLGLRMEF
jgi:outer membrane autotransporter protein